MIYVCCVGFASLDVVCYELNEIWMSILYFRMSFSSAILYIVVLIWREKNMCLVYLGYLWFVY